MSGIALKKQEKISRSAIGSLTSSFNKMPFFWMLNISDIGTTRGYLSYNQNGCQPED